jgi:RNA polymerase sigma-70 factor (ECF subfamily)
MAKQRADTDIAQLVADHHAAVYRYAYRLAGSVADAEDLTQAVFLTAREKGDQLRQPDRVRGWLLAIARNRFLKEVKRRRPETASDLALDLCGFPDGRGDDDIDREQLQQAIGELPEVYRVVLLMFYFEEASYREIAEQLEIPMGTVMSRLARAKSHLRARLLAADNPDQQDEQARQAAATHQ